MRSIQRNGEDAAWGGQQSPKQLPVRYLGVKTLLLGDTSSSGMCSRSEVEYLQWQNTDGIKFRAGKKSFRSEERYASKVSSVAYAKIQEVHECI